jgi:glycosyltransferase involved in cell wall biosynthesis
VNTRNANNLDISTDLSVIVPVRNEASTIETIIRQLREELPLSEILIVDGGNDKTEMLTLELLKLDSKIVYYKNRNDRGKGHAIQIGIQLATKPYIAQIDADLQFCPKDLVPMLHILKTGKSDFVCGSRFLNQSKRSERSVPGARLYGNLAISLYASCVAGFRLTDVLAGIKMWKREVTSAFQLKSNNYCYEVELPIKAKRCGFRVTDYPVQTSAREFGASSVNVVTTGLHLLRDIPKFMMEKL